MGTQSIAREELWPPHLSGTNLQGHDAWEERDLLAKEVSRVEQGRREEREARRCKPATIKPRARTSYLPAPAQTWLTSCKHSANG